MPAVITGTGVAIPPNIVTNDDLTRIMDTTDEWIVSRTGVRSRRFTDPGTGTSDLAAEAGRAALADASVDPSAVDAVVCATMTPDRQNPGIAGAVQHKAGLDRAAVFDLRQQCAGFLFGLDLADMLIATGRAGTVVVAGAEVHAGYLPWGDAWDIVLGRTDRTPTADERALATRHRAWSVLFGDGAAAMVLQEQPGGPAPEAVSEAGILGSVLRTDGANADLIEVPGLGSEQRPYADAAQIADGLHHPTMNGGGLYRLAVETMPAAV
ncbi:MAG: 3-oxoacyl-ACP synthase, partial [Acidimicrobiaceae bacterium]|nr:3-oxoacyl-ACP synthase [Acidimicrobiaceae bacterium]